MIKAAGMFRGASVTLAALATPAGASSEDEDADDIAGLWQGIVSALDNSIPPFKTFAQYGGGVWARTRPPGLEPAERNNVRSVRIPPVGSRTIRRIRSVRRV